MHNGDQQPMQPLAGPSRHGQQATRLVSGIPFSHHGASAQSNAYAAVGRSADARASMQTALQNVSGIASSAHQNSFTANGQMAHMSMNAPQAYRNQPPQNIHAHRPSMSHGEHAPLPPLVQGYAPQRQIVMHRGLPMPTRGTPTSHPQSTMQRIPSQCIHPSMAPPQTQHSASVSNMHAHMAHGQSNVGPHAQMTQMGQPLHPQPVQSAPPLPPSSHVQHNLVDVHRHLAQAHAQDMQQLREQAQRAQPQQFSAPAPTPAPPSTRSQPFAQQTAQQPAPPPSGPSALASASGQPPPSQTQSSNPPQDTVLSAQFESSMTRSANAQAQCFIEPARLSVMDGLSRTHQAFADELARLYKMITQRDDALRQVQAQYDVLRSDLTREKALRERAERECEEVRSRKDYAEQESRNMNVHVPRMLKEYFEMRKEREELAQEIAALREANTQLREKAAVTRVDDAGDVFELPEVKDLVKTEDRLLASCFTRVKTEHAPKNAGDASMDAGDHDAEFAQVLATAHEERKRRQRAERDLEAVKSILQTTGLHTPASESTSNYAPPMPAPETEHEPDVPAAASEVAPASSEMVADMVTDTSAEQPDTSAQPPKIEQQDNPISWFPVFPPEVLDLTNILDDSPMQLTIDLPPLTRTSEGPTEPERKRSFDVGVGAGSRPSSPKRRRTMDDVGAETEPDVEEGELSLPWPHVSEASAEDGEVAPTSAPATDAIIADLPPTPNIESASNLSEPHSPPTPDPSGRILLPYNHPVHPVLCLPFPSTDVAVQYPGQQQLMTPISPTMPAPFAPPASPKKLSMRHIPLIYDTVNGRMSCRMCQARCDEFRDQQDVPIDKRPRPYILNAASATWDEMAGHCERVHPKAYEGLISMTPDQMRVKEQQFGLCGRAGRK